MSAHEVLFKQIKHILLHVLQEHLFCINGGSLPLIQSIKLGSMHAVRPYNLHHLCDLINLQNLEGVQFFCTLKCTYVLRCFQVHSLSSLVISSVMSKSNKLHLLMSFYPQTKLCAAVCITLVLFQDHLKMFVRNITHHHLRPKLSNAPFSKI